MTHWGSGNRRAVVLVAVVFAIGTMVMAAGLAVTGATPWLSTACFVAMSGAVTLAYVAGRGRPVCVMNASSSRPLPIGTLAVGAFVVAAFVATLTAS